MSRPEAPRTGGIAIKSAGELDAMRRAGRLAAQVLTMVEEHVRPGARLGDVGAAIQSQPEAQGFSVVREYCGHGIGPGFHEEPQVLHHGEPGTGLELVPGMCFTIEPMINAGRPGSRELPDGWTVVTRDHSLSAQWEHTCAVVDNGVPSFSITDHLLEKSPCSTTS